MPDRRDQDYLQDILEASDRASRYLDGVSYEQFRKDTKTQDAVIRTLEIIGEATKGLSSELRANYADVPWRSMAGLRDRLIHSYFGINLDIVWQIANDELPPVAQRVREIAREM